MASFGSLRSAIYDREARKQQYQAHIRGLNAFDRHKKFLNDYAGFYGKGQPAQEKLPVKTDQDTLREGYRFIRSEEDDLDTSWEQRLVKRYYDKLFKDSDNTEASSTMVKQTSSDFICSSFGNIPISICPIKFNRNNYFEWSRAFLLAIQARGMEGYLNGENKKPATAGTELQKWGSENSLVMSWLTNAMLPTIARGYLFFHTAEDIWSAVREAYSQVGNVARVYELRKKVNETKMDGIPLVQYYTELSCLWNELDFYQDFQAQCPDDAISYKRIVDKERVYDFLAGLPMEFDSIRQRVLNRKPFPTLRQAHAAVQKDDQHRAAMTPSLPKERCTLVTIPQSSVVGNLGSSSDKSDSRIRCDYCDRPWHTRETCWKLHPHLKPPVGRGKGGDRGDGGGRPPGPQSRAYLSEAFELHSTSSDFGGISPQDEEKLVRRLMAKYAIDGGSSTASTFPEGTGDG